MKTSPRGLAAGAAFALAHGDRSGARTGKGPAVGAAKGGQGSRQTRGRPVGSSPWAWGPPRRGSAVSTSSSATRPSTACSGARSRRRCPLTRAFGPTTTRRALRRPSNGGSAATARTPPSPRARPNTRSGSSSSKPRMPATTPRGSRRFPYPLSGAGGLVDFLSSAAAGATQPVTGILGGTAKASIPIEPFEEHCWAYSIKVDGLKPIDPELRLEGLRGVSSWEVCPGLGESRAAPRSWRRSG